MPRTARSHHGMLSKRRVKNERTGTMRSQPRAKTGDNGNDSSAAAEHILAVAITGDERGRRHNNRAGVGVSASGLTLRARGCTMSV